MMCMMWVQLYLYSDFHLLFQAKIKRMWMDYYSVDNVDDVDGYRDDDGDCCVMMMKMMQLLGNEG